MSSRTFSFRFLPLLTLALFFSLTSCDTLTYRPNAIGKEGEITVVIDSTQWKGPVGAALKDQLAPFIGTLPAPERMFDLKQTTLFSDKALDLIRKQKNVVFVAPLSDTTNEALFLKSRLNPEATQAIMDGQFAVIPRHNLWANQQQVYYIMASSAEDLVRAINENGEDLQYGFNKITRERLFDEMFEKGRQKDIEAVIMEKHGFTVNVQHDYFIAIDTTDFVWLRRVLSDTWRSQFVHDFDNVNPADLTPEWIYETRNAITREYVQGNLGGYVAIDFRRSLETKNIDFLGHYGFETRGLWHMIGEDEEGNPIEYGMGGPFLTYTFYDEDTGRTFMIDGMVFAPGFTKREFLRHMEVIAHTFRTDSPEKATEQIAAHN